MYVVIFSVATRKPIRGFDPQPTRRPAETKGPITLRE